MRALISVLVLSAALTGQPASGQVVSGRALNALTQTGIPHMRVMLAPLSGDTKPQLLWTDAQGQVFFNAARPGAYSFACLSRDYVPATSGRQMKVQINPRQLPPKLECDMVPLPRLTGRVMDGNGKPVAGARVELLDPASGQGSFVTDEKGRIDWPLRPGSYAFFVDPPAGLAPPASDGASARAVVWARTYFPGTRFRDGAEKVRLRFNEPLPPIEMKLATAPAYEVRGTLLTEFARPPRDTDLVVTQDGFEGDGLHVKPRADGSFEFGPVPEGEWHITAEDKFRAASEWIEVRGRDVEDLQVRMKSSFTVRAGVRMNRRARKFASEPAEKSWTPEIALVPARADAGIANWMLVPDMGIAPAGDDGDVLSEAAGSLRTRILDEAGAIHASESSTGDYDARPVFPGTYRIAVAPPPQPWYLDSVRVGEIDVAASPAEITSAPMQITVVYGSNGGAVQGRATGCAGGFVVLMPEDVSRQWFGYVHSVWCDASDRYQIGAVRPGEYSLIALTGAAPPVLDQEVLKQAAKVTIGAGQTTLFDLVAVQPF